MPKPTEADKEFFTELFADHPEVEVKPMFGNLGAFVNGNMVGGLFGGAVGLRLSQSDRAALEAEPGSGPFGPEDRPMKDYVAMPESWRSQPDVVRDWAGRAVVHTASMPPRKPKPKKAR